MELVRTGLMNMGLQARRLNTRELIDLFYQIYNPETSREQKIPQDMDKLSIDQTAI
jgi:hypothetical protein